MAQRRIIVGPIEDVSGEVNIAGGNIYKGYSAQQVTALLEEITTRFQTKRFVGRCPYKGLEVFEEEDAELFFGREKLIVELIERVKESRAVFITGPSGSGKSSLVRAGLIPALKQGVIKKLHSERWLYETLKPGREPIKDLSLAFSRLKSPELAKYFQDHANEASVLNECAESVLSGRKDQRFLLFVDQFEEVFTQISQEADRVEFLNMLTEAATVASGRVIVIIAMRSDFVSNCATYPALNEMLSREFRQIGAMQPEELVSAIALPAKQVGLPIEAELIAQIINDMKGEPAALPLMQFALKDLFDSQQEKGGDIELTLEDYLHHGGIHKSLERHADDAFAKLSEAEQQLARSIFSGLIEVGRGTQDTRRTALFEELVPAHGDPADVTAIVQKLADARLIITDEQAGQDTVTIAHEKLIDAWPWLKKLVNENRDVIALQNEIASDAKEWEDHQRDPSYLYTGARLVNVSEQLNTNMLVLSGLAQEFVQAGRARRLRGQVALIVSLSAVIVLLFFAVIVFRSQAQQNVEIANTAQVASTFAIAQQGTAQANAAEAEKQAKISRLRELAAQSVILRDMNFPISLLLGVEVFKTADTLQTRGTLIDDAYSNPQLQAYLRGHTGTVPTVAFSPDGKTLASGGTDQTIILWDVATRQPIGQPLRGHTDYIISIAFSPDGKILASASFDDTVMLWDVASGRPIGQPLRKHKENIRTLAFSPDGKTLASGSEDNTIMLWDVASGQPIGQPLQGATDYDVNSVAFDPDGKILASGSQDNTIILWDVASGQPIGQPLSKHADDVYTVAFSPDGRTLASGDRDSTIILWDVETRQPIGQPLREHKNAIFSVAFSPDGKTLASASADHTIKLWDVATEQPIGQPLLGHTDFVNSVAFSPDGRTLASGGWDSTIILWDVSTVSDRNLPAANREPLNGHTAPVRSVAFSPDGKILASAAEDNMIILWDVQTKQRIGQPLLWHTNEVLGIAFSTDGKFLASASADQTIVLWDAKTRKRIGQPLRGHTGEVLGIAFSPDGKTLASASADQTIILWDVESRKPIGQPLREHKNAVFSVTFSLDGKLLASGSKDKTIILWDVATQQPVGQPLNGHTNSVYSVAFSPDRKLLASGSFDGTVMLWDVETRQLVGSPLSGHLDYVTSVAFSPDGKMLVSGSRDNTIILWDVATRQPIGQPLTGHKDLVYSVAFSPDSALLASGSMDRSIILWAIDPHSLVKKICARVGRNFTRTEWAQYIGGEEPYRATCADLPIESAAAQTP